MNKKRVKKLIAVLIVSCTFLVPQPISTLASPKLYEQVTTQPVTKGVTYQKNHRLTADGWQDINILRVDLNDSNIRIEPVESLKEYGLKETVLTLLSDSNAVAGVNASFFGMKGNYSASFGPVMKDGKLISAGSDINAQKDEYATFFVDKDGVPFIDFFRVSLEFYNNGQLLFEIAAVNKVSNMVYPLYFDRNAAADTAQLDARFSDLVKIVVENNVITKISQKGEVVAVPENGYLIIINGTTYDNSAQEYAVGQSAEFRLVPSLDLSKIQTAISGAGFILQEGQQSMEGMIIQNRQPRTAIGITQDKNQLIIMTVDGRGDSIGATQWEMGDLMMEFGAYEAMHFDGGGSTTMVVKTAEEESLSVKNQVSDQSQRRVINALGVFNDGPLGEMTQLVISPSSERVFQGSQISFSVYGYDEYYHKIEVPIADVSFSSSDDNGVFSGNTFSPSIEGNIAITAEYNGLSAVTNIESMKLATIQPSIEAVHLEVGQSTPLTFLGISEDGFSAPVTGVSVSSSLGTYENGVFTATTEGAEYAFVTYGNVICYLKVSVGGKWNLISSFEDMSNMNFTTYPSGMPGDGLKSRATVYDGAEAVGLKYKFEQMDTTQAAYLHFKEPIPISGTPSALSLAVYGNHTNAWVRGQLTDANGKEFLVDFTKNLDWDGWQEVKASIPSGIAYPISLNMLYVADLSNDILEDQIVYFDKLMGLYPHEIVGEKPAETGFADNRNVSIGPKQEDGYYINLSGTVSFSDEKKRAENYDDARLKVHQALQQDADLMVYAGDSDIFAESSVDTIKWNSGYYFYEKPNVSIVQLTAITGSMRTSNTWQWQAFKSDVLSSSNKNVIFMIDRTPSAFNDDLEAQLFLSALDDLRKAGKNIFVVSSSGTTGWNSVKEGIRYINIPDLWYPTGNLNIYFKTLRIKVTPDTMYYELKNMFS